MRLLALDPGGKHTGWCTFRGGRLEAHGTSEGLTTTHDLLTLWASQVDEIATERYIIYSTSPDGVNPIKIMGIAEYLARQQNLPYAEYTASQTKKVMTDKVLRENGFWFPGAGHDRDAIRVAMFHLAKKHPYVEIGR